MNLKRIALLIGVALVTGAAGYFAGLFALLAATDLHEAEWVPVAALAGIGLAAGLGAGLTARISSAAAGGLAATASAAGALVGFAVKETIDSFEWTIFLGVVLALLVAIIARALAANRPPASS